MTPALFALHSTRVIKNPRPEGAESTLTGNAASPFPAEPRHDQQVLNFQMSYYFSLVSTSFDISTITVDN
jgi:hypothetical protein